MENERERWNSKYREGSHFSLEADPLLPYAYKEFVQPLFPSGGDALDVAGGVGRHSIWMAQQGWKVRLMDISEVGVAQAKENAGEYRDRIDFEVGDLTSIELKPASFDLVMVFFYLERTIFSKLMDAIRPGGLLAYKTYTHLAPKFGRGPRHPLHLLQENELLRAFSGMTVLHYAEKLGTAELVASKKS